MNYSPERPFMNLTDACKASGCSVYYLRQGCRAGRIPHIKSGAKFLVNVPALLEMLDAESRNQTEREAVKARLSSARIAQQTKTELTDVG